jgi:hypothetical protein
MSPANRCVSRWHADNYISASRVRMPVNTNADRVPLKAEDPNNLIDIKFIAIRVILLCCSHELWKPASIPRLPVGVTNRDRVDAIAGAHIIFGHTKPMGRQCNCRPNRLMLVICQRQ